LCPKLNQKPGKSKDEELNKTKVGIEKNAQIPLVSILTENSNKINSEHEEKKVDLVSPVFGEEKDVNFCKKSEIKTGIQDELININIQENSKEKWEISQNKKIEILSFNNKDQNSENIEQEDILKDNELKTIEAKESSQENSQKSIQESIKSDIFNDIKDNKVIESEPN